MLQGSVRKEGVELVQLSVANQSGAKAGKAELAKVVRKALLVAKAVREVSMVKVRRMIKVRRAKMVGVPPQEVGILTTSARTVRTGKIKGTSYETVQLSQLSDPDMDLHAQQPIACSRVAILVPKA